LNRLSARLCGIVVLLSPHALLAQHGGHAAGAGRPSTGASNPAPNTSDINDFNRAIALQATPDQVARFRQLMKSTEAATKEAHDLTQHTENAGKPESSLYAGLNDAVEDARNNNLQFLRTFSASQQSGLKHLTKKLSKADSDVSKQSKTLAKELERSEIDSKKTADVVQKLDKALTGFQAEQLDIGKEMGIPPAENSR
jgi:hypothetical protein